MPLVPPQRKPSSPTHILHLREGEVWASETLPGLWAVSWYPHRADDPDYPGSTIDSTQESMPIEEGPDAILEWA
jgi:hypothetical protein